MVGKTPILCENFAPSFDWHGSAKKTNDSEVLIVWNSNVMASKGFFDVIEALKVARKSAVNLSVVVLGRPLSDNEMSAEECRAELGQLSKNSWIRYVGPVSAEDALNYTAMADLIVFPSRYASECQPLAIVQAMCAGCSIILSDTPALRATIDDYPAVFLTNPTVDDLTLSILAVTRLGCPERKSEAAASARDRFSVERFDKVMADVLR
jgi:glycosyltransferase involved in cell wall biosynthesis